MSVESCERTPLPAKSSAPPASEYCLLTPEEMAVAKRLAAGAGRPIDWRLRDLVYASLFALCLMFPLTYLTLPMLLRSRWFLVTVGVGVEALAVVPAVLLIARWRGARSWSQLGLGRYPWRGCLALGLGGGLALCILIQVCGAVLARLGAHTAPQQILAETILADPTPGRLALFLLASSLAAPIWEEIFFRGLAYPVFRRKLGIVAGCLLSAALFTMLHAEPLPLRLPIFLLGICLAALYEWSGSLYVPIIAHGLANAISTVLAYLGYA